MEHNNEKSREHSGNSKHYSIAHSFGGFRDVVGQGAEREQESNTMTQNHELVVKGTRNFENKIAVILTLRDKKRFACEIFDLHINLERQEGATLEFYESEAIKRAKTLFRDVAAGLCEGDELSPEKRPIILQAQNVWITYKGKLPGRITGSLKTPPESQP